MTPDGLVISTGETVLFWVVAPLMVLAALGLLFVKRAVHAAMCLVFVMVSMAILYIAQEAPFLGVVQVVVYTGAVMMLFLFVLMLVGVDASDSLTETIRGQRWLGLLIGIGLAVILGGVVSRAAFPPPVGLAGGDPGGVANPQALARVLFGDYVLAMEAVGVLLVTAAVGALVLTHRRRLTPKQDQRAVADARIRALPEGVVLTPLPSPGVYATSNAMDTPALGPDGEQVPQSVSRVLRIRGQEKAAPHAPGTELVDVRTRDAGAAEARTTEARTEGEA
ncbi:NADH-quinone oxidoreductase subunit J [Promicromonospora sp. NPDC060204]|uniref:NADH-quinone oxidoreductase subunit J n=1 Tax=Promicromonospora sp. NPDC060204 TaxID=3347071 RepID=UPI003660489E